MAIVSQDPKFVIKKKITELAKPLNTISLKFYFLINIPMPVATANAEYVKNIVL